MNICSEFNKKIIDYLEHQLSDEDEKVFSEHLKHCEQCQKDYAKLKNLYALLDKDEVILPEQEFFENLKIKIRQKTLIIKKSSIWKIAKILVPVAVAAVLLLILYRPNGTVEIAVPTSILLEDKEIASLGLEGVVDDQLIQDLEIVEEYLLSYDVDKLIEELSEAERSQLIGALYKKYETNI
jgi:hypothetical protein